MTAGIIQLVACGIEDLFLSGDPQITFFKIIYRRYTNFSREDIQQSFIHEPNFGEISSCIISFEGDLIDKMALVVRLPEIPKFLDTKTKIAWVKKIGFAMIKSIEIEINDTVIDRHYGEWLYIWSTLITRNINDNGLNKLIGNVPELIDFTNGKCEYTLYIPLQFWFCRITGSALPLVSLQYCDIKINVEFYPLDKCLYISPTHYIKCVDNIVNFEKNEFLYQKEFNGKECYGMFSHYDVIEKRLYYMHITAEKFRGLPINRFIKNIKNNTDKCTIHSTIHGVSSDFYVRPEPGAKSITVFNRSLKNITIPKCYLLVDYVYLDQEERLKFAQTKHDYLIEQLYFTPNIAIDSINRKVKLDIDQPCKLQVWLAQLDYIHNYNDRFNYTNSHIIKRPYDVYDSVYDSVYDNDEDDELYNDVYYDNIYDNAYSNSCDNLYDICNIHYDNPEKRRIFDRIKVGEEIGHSLFDEETLLLNSQVRLKTRSYKYFEYIQPIQHFDNRLPKGCAMYSYALFPSLVIPSGTTNMSQIELIEIMLKMSYCINTHRAAKFRAYALCYGIWRVNNGLSATVFIR